MATRAIRHERRRSRCRQRGQVRADWLLLDRSFGQGTVAPLRTRRAVVEAELADRDSLAPALEQLTFAEMTEIVSELLGEAHRSFSLRFSNARLEAAVSSLVTGEDRSLLEPLMEGLHGDLTVERYEIRDVFGVKPMPFVDAARQAIATMPTSPPSSAKNGPCTRRAVAQHLIGVPLG